MAAAPAKTAQQGHNHEQNLPMLTGLTGLTPAEAQALPHGNLFGRLPQELLAKVEEDALAPVKARINTTTRLVPPDRDPTGHAFKVNITRGSGSTFQIVVAFHAGNTAASEPYIYVSIAEPHTETMREYTYTFTTQTLEIGRGGKKIRRKKTATLNGWPAQGIGRKALLLPREYAGAPIMIKVTPHAPPRTPRRTGGLLAMARKQAKREGRRPRFAYDASFQDTC